MGFLEHLHTWSKGEITQGRWMLVFAVILLPIIVSIVKSTHSLQKGMTIPLILLFAIQVGYGSYLLLSRSKQQQKTEKQFQQNQRQVITVQLSKAENDSKNYTQLKYVWGILTIISLIGYFTCPTEYYKGLNLGFAVMFLTLVTTDTLLHQRLKVYLGALQKLIE